MRSRNPNFSGIRLAAPGSGLFGKLLSIAAGTLLLVAALLFSLFAVSVLADCCSSPTCSGKPDTCADLWTSTCARRCGGRQTRPMSRQQGDA